MLNRSAVTVCAREPFLRWPKPVSRDTTTTLGEINSETDAYILPDYEDDDERQHLLSRYYNMIFEGQLAGWWTEEADWPQKRDAVMFTRWFSV